jgi:DNA repair protein RecN (Recombination protein N)
MISELKIRNYAIIDEIHLDWRKGFIVITGETGAGKSILFNAIELCMGGRANVEMIRQGQDKACLELSIDLSDRQQQWIYPILEENDCDLDDILHIKRVLCSSGRNRVYINGSRVRLEVLRTISGGLIDIVGQHANQILLCVDSHISILDGFAGLQKKSSQVANQFHVLQKLQKEAQKLIEQEDVRRSKMNVIQKQLDDIEFADLTIGEDEKLNTSIAMHLNAEAIRQSCLEASYRLGDAEGSALESLSSSIGVLRRISHLNPDLTFVVEALDKMRIEVSELSRDIGQFSEGVNTDAEAIEIMEERLELIERLKRDNGGSIDKVLNSRHSLQTELDQLSNKENRLLELQSSVVTLETKLMEESKLLSFARQESAKSLARIVESELFQLGMPNCRFTVRFRYFSKNQQVNDINHTTPDALRSVGLDRVEFLISPNPGEGFKPLIKVASGGELSRLLLALKSALIKTDPVETYIFDEVDSGIGGGIAETVGQKLQNIGQVRQVFCITHLAQVACCAHYHLKVVKKVEGERTTSLLKYLSFDERVEEVARMLGGSEITTRTLAHATEMLRSSQPIVTRLVS